MTFPSPESLFKIYSSILAGYLKPFKKSTTINVQYKGPVYNIYYTYILYSLLYRLSYPLFIVSGLQDLSDTITTATLELYNRIVRDLPPTPSKFHYIFNLRDLSRIYHALSLITPDRFDIPDSLVRVWRNECHHVFYDRLTNDKDRTLVKVILLVLLSMF